MKNIWFIFFLFLSTHISGQLSFDFEEHTLSNWQQYPANRWEITQTDPINGSGSLKHTFDNSEESRDRISFAHQISISNQPTTWRFQVKYDYNPSGSNNWGFFLMADSAASEMYPSGAVNGYLVGVNYSGFDDLLKLWKISSGSGYEVVTSNFNWQEEIEAGTVVGVEVQYNGAGLWSLLVDTNGGFDDLNLIGSAENTDYTESKYSGIYYEYTSSADQKLWLDDIYIGPPVTDTMAPTIKNAQILNEHQIRLEFSETMEGTALTNPANYMLDNELNPTSIDEWGTSKPIVDLVFTQSFQDSTSYQLNIQHLADTSGNHLTDTTTSLFYNKMKVTRVHPTSNHSIQVEFNKTPDSASVAEITKYILLPGQVHPSTLFFLPETNNGVTLEFEQPLEEETIYTLEIESIQDQYGDSSTPTTVNFSFLIPGENDIIITEIMADPYPTAGLPEKEYIEIYNPTQTVIDLTNWKLTIDNSEVNFPIANIAAKEYLILCDNDSESDMNSYGPTVAFSSFPTLPNSGANISITDTSSLCINQAPYNLRWYKDEEKEDGGYALEKIDPDNNCSGINNWQASIAGNGGTPGRQNSVYAANKDTTPPRISYMEVIHDQQIDLQFNEPIDTASLDRTDFTISPSIGAPYSLNINAPYHDMVSLFFAQPLTNNTIYELKTEIIQDLCGNDTSFQKVFTYHEPLPYEIQINEIMADPEPNVGLPEHEYVELYNASSYRISLNNWQISIGNTNRALGRVTLLPGSFLIVCDKKHVSAFREYGKIHGIDNLPSINNNGEPIVLSGTDKEIISYVNFDESWYPDEYAQEGGWSLEQMDPGNPCGGQTNWSASTHSTGGTPGKTNSIHSENPDYEPPILLRASFIDSTSVKLHFNEPIQKETANQPDHYRADQKGHPFEAIPVKPHYKAVILNFAQPFETHTLYQISVLDTIKDCAGNAAVSKQTVPFKIPGLLEENDLVINEILFNPNPGGNNFIEIYNRTEKTLALEDLCIGSGTDYNDILCMESYEYLIFPSQHIVFTENPTTINRDYFVEYPEQIIAVSDLPTYSDQEGTAFLMNKSKTIIDKMDYQEEMHFPLLRDEEGVSLERIHYERPSEDQSNWHSAAESAGFATPTYKNSQYSENIDPDMNFTIEPEVFSPDNDGRDDILNIHYSFDQPGHVANIKIFDSRGRLEKNLVSNKTLGTKGTITWNGINEDNIKSRMGIYIIFLEIFDLQGNVRKIKKHCVVGEKQ